MLELSTVALEEIAAALQDQNGWDHRWLIDPQSGQKDRLHQNYPELLPAWHAFQAIRAKRRAVQWLVDNSLVDQHVAAAPTLPMSACYASTQAGSS